MALLAGRSEPSSTAKLYPRSTGAPRQTTERARRRWRGAGLATECCAKTFVSSGVVLGSMQDWQLAAAV